MSFSIIVVPKYCFSKGKTKMFQMHFCICERHHTKDHQITVVASVFVANNWNSAASQ